MTWGTHTKVITQRINNRKTVESFEEQVAEAIDAILEENEIRQDAIEVHYSATNNAMTVLLIWRAPIG